MRIGILALQGAFQEHGTMLKTLDVQVTYIRSLSNLNDQIFAGLILPGGESTVIGKLLVDLGLMEPLKQRILQGLPVFSTCAGLLLLAREIVNDKRVHLGTMKVTVRRNAYGRQLGSFAVSSVFQGIGTVPMTFIRAPWIQSVSSDVEVLARVDGQIVAARDRNMLATAFHPELTNNTKVHEYFLAMCRSYAEHEASELVLHRTGCCEKDSESRPTDADCDVQAFSV